MCRAAKSSTKVAQRSGKLMPIEIRFEPIQVATRGSGEEGYLVYASQQLVALLVPSDTGWFVELSLGFCAQEGLIFRRISEVEDWVHVCLSAS